VPSYRTGQVGLWKKEGRERGTDTYRSIDEGVDRVGPDDVLGREAGVGGLVEVGPGRFL
jgi:hypothetical protein